MRYLATTGLALLILATPVLGSSYLPIDYLPIDFENLDREAAAALGVGYVERPCGFDLNDDGIIGGPEDCSVCDDLEGTTQVLEDFDGDGAFEVQTYVDAQAFAGDDPLCGGPENPCQTVMYAKRNRMVETEGENVICFRGVGHESLLDGGLVNGQEGFRIVPDFVTENGVPIDWQLPSNPTMLVGWDFDQDNQYAPFDTDDIADFDGEILLADGTTSYLNHFWQSDCYEKDEGACTQAKNFKSTARWEIAHLRVREYGTLPDPDPSRGIFHAVRHDTWSGAPVEMGSHVYYHDIHIDRMNYGGETRSGSMIVEGWDRSFEEFYTYENLLITEFCGYIWRGGGGNGPKDNFLIKNTSVNYVCDPEPSKATASTPGIKLWGTYTGVYVYRNFWDQSPAEWAIPGVTKVAGGIMSINTCIEDFYAEENIFKNSQDYFVVQGGLLRGCQQRNGNNLNYQNNLAINDDDFNSFIAINISSGRDQLVFTENISVANNVFLDLGEVPNMKRAIHIGDEVYGGDDADLDPSDDWIKIVGNTFYSPEPNGYSGWFTVGAGDRRKLDDGTFGVVPDKSHNYLVENNIFASETADRSFPGYQSTYHPALGNPLDIIMTMEGNVWELTPHPDQGASRRLFKSNNGDFNIGTNDLTEFSAHTGWSATDKGYEQNWCKVEFEDRDHGDVRIAETDTCANGAGANLDWLERSDPEPPVPFCGDGTCDAGEDHATCPEDCEAPPPPVTGDTLASFGAKANETTSVEVCTVTDIGTISICREVEEVGVQVRERDQ